VWVGLILATSGIGCDRLPGRPEEADRFVRPDRLLDPDALLARHCTGCHGEPGRIGPARDLGDPLYLAWIGRQGFRRTTEEGVAGTPMPAFARSAGGPLTDRQIAALVDGLYARHGDAAAGFAAELPPASESEARRRGLEPGDPARGEIVFGERCSSCHGGLGGVGGSVTDPAYLALTSDAALRSAVVVGRPELGMPPFRGYEGEPALGDQEISDVVAWLAAQRPERPSEERRSAAAGLPRSEP
jgi:mono/diheme cytochrome c family protein